MPPSPLARVRRICLGFPGAHEVEAWGEPTFRYRNKLFAMYASAENHHGAGQPSVWIKSTAVNQGFLLAEHPKRIFAPPYVGPSGWIGVRLGGRVSWKLVELLLRDGYELLAGAKVPAGRGGRTTATHAPAGRRGRRGRRRAL